MHSKNNQPNIDWNIVLQTAISLENQGRYAEALKGYEILSKHCSKQPSVQNSYGSLLLKMGDYDRAIRAFNKSLDVDKKQADVYFMMAVALHQTGLFGKAVINYNHAIKLQANFEDAYLNRGVSLYSLKQYDEAISSYDKALAINPDLEDAWFNKAILLQDLKQHHAALANYERAIEIKPDYADAYYNYGNTLYELLRYEEAVGAFDKSIALRQNFLEAYFNKAKSLKALLRYHDAIESYQKVLQLQPDYIEAYYNCANCFYLLKQYKNSLEIADRAITIKPNYAHAYLIKGMCLHEFKKFIEAIACYDKAITLDADCAEAYVSRGEALFQLNQFEQAKICYEKAIALENTLGYAYKGHGNVSKQLKNFSGLISGYKQALKYQPDMDFIAGDLLFAQMQACEWSDFSESLNSIMQALAADKKAVMPFVALNLMDRPDLHFKAAKIYADSILPSARTLPEIQVYAEHSKIKLGYFSADFHAHPSMHLMAELLELHDKNRFELIAFSFIPKIDDLWQKRAIRAFDQFYDVRSMTDVEIAALSRQLEIDIAIDINGYTKDCRPRIFFERAAPVQIGFLGYPGTVAAPYIDYIVADNTIISEQNACFFSEKIIRMPNYYAPTCSEQQISQQTVVRADFGLPENQFIFCSFNATQKITPSMFDCWMQILRETPNSVLWIYINNDLAKENLKHEAWLRRVSEDKLVFAEQLPAGQHLNRLRLADLMLDTFPYGAHTTGTDALRMGLPLLTCSGKSFASRVAASLLTAVGLPELIAGSIEAYQATAIELATNPQQLASLKHKLRQNLSTTALFRTEQYARDIESVYSEIHHQADKFIAE